MRAPTRKAVKRRCTLLLVTWIAACTSRVTTNIQARTTNSDVRLAREQGEDDEHVEEQRQLELVVIRVGDLRRAFRPGRLAQRDIGDRHLAPLERADAHEAHPEQQEEGEPDLDEEREENRSRRSCWLRLASGSSGSRG